MTGAAPVMRCLREVTPEQVAEILLVQAAEVARPAAVPPEARIDALEAAGDLDDECRWFARRAAFLPDLDLGSTSPMRYSREPSGLLGSVLLG